MRYILLINFLLVGHFSKLAAQNELIESPSPFVWTEQPGYNTQDGLRYNSPEDAAHPDFGKMTFSKPYGKNVVEVLSKRTVDERYYVDLDDATFFYIEKSNSAINFYDNGYLRAIDPSLHKVNDFYYESGPQPIPTALDLMNNRAVMKVGTDHIGVAHVILEMTDMNDSVILVLPDWSNISVGNFGAHVTDIFPGIDFEIVYREAGFKTNYIIKQNLGMKKLRFIDQMDLPDHYQLIMEGDEFTSLFVQMHNSLNGETEIVVSPCRTHDASGNKESWINPYSIEGDNLIMLCDSLLLNGVDKVYPLSVDPLFTAVGPIASAANIRGSLLTPAFCSHSINVTFPGGSTPWDVSAGWNLSTDFCAGLFIQFGVIIDCWMSEAEVWLTSSCGGASPVGAPGTIWTCVGCNTFGNWIPTLPFASSGTQSLAQCYTPSCANQTLTFTINNRRTFCNTYGVYDNCVWANAYCSYLNQWNVTVQGRTLETLGNTVTGNGSQTINDADCVGTAVLNPTPLYGVAPYTFSWSTGATSSTITVGVTPAVYTCTVTTACGASVVATFNIGCPLAARLNYFNAWPNENEIELSWETLAEDGIVKFVVERAGENGEFKTLSEIDSKGISSGASYTITDEQPISGVNYYRLGLVYDSGEIEYSETQTVIFNSKDELSIVPNPSNGQFILVFESPAPSTYQVEIINASGAIIHRSEITTENKVTSANLDLTGLGAGVYTVRLTSGEKTISNRLVIR